MRSTALALVAVLVCLPRLADAEEWIVIVHADRASKLELADIAQIYLKQRRFWDDGSVIVPVNRSAGSRARETFARAVLKVESGSLVAYWNRQYFQGVLPPIALASNAAVLRFVATEPRAIGYLPAAWLERESNDLDVSRVRVALRFKDPIERSNR